MAEHRLRSLSCGLCVCILSSCAWYLYHFKIRYARQPPWCHCVCIMSAGACRHKSRAGVLDAVAAAQSKQFLSAGGAGDGQKNDPPRNTFSGTWNIHFLLSALSFLPNPDLQQTPDPDSQHWFNEWVLERERERENPFNRRNLQVTEPEHYHSMVKMHLSFLLDLHTDECDCSFLYEKQVGGCTYLADERGGPGGDILSQS